MSLKLTSIALFSGLAVSFLACSADTAPPSNRPAGTAGTGTAGTGTAGGGAGGTPAAGTGGTGGAAVGGSGGSLGGSTFGGSTFGGSGGSTTACAPVGAEMPLPLLISESTGFIASGYFSGPEFLDETDPLKSHPNTTKITGDKTEGACTKRAENPGDECYKFTFAPEVFDATEGTAWGGVFWQAGANNWGSSPGYKVAAGATKVTFYAWSDADKTKVSFSAGSIQGDKGLMCWDGVQFTEDALPDQELTLEPTQYTISLVGKKYDNTGIIGGFSWSAEVTEATGPITLYIDNIRWE